MLIVTGLPCAGKSTFGKTAALLGYSVVEGSDAVKEMHVTQCLAQEDIIAFCNRLYSERGSEVFARENHRRMTSMGFDLDSTVFIGCRSIGEVEYLRELGTIQRVVAVHADTSIRFGRCHDRNRTDRPATFEDFLRRDMREYDMGLAGILASKVDTFMMNEGTLEEFEASVSVELHTTFITNR